MGRRFKPVRRTGTTVPRVQEVQYATGQTFLDGALVTQTVNGELPECGADPAAVYGVAGNACGSLPGYDLPNSSVTTVITNRRQKVSVVIADREQEFSGRGVNGGTDPVLPLQTHIGEQYGVAKVGNDWVIDFAETVAKVVQITDIRPDDNTFLFKFLQSVLVSP